MLPPNSWPLKNCSHLDCRARICLFFVLSYVIIYDMYIYIYIYTHVPILVTVSIASIPVSLLFTEHAFIVLAYRLGIKHGNGK